MHSKNAALRRLAGMLGLSLILLYAPTASAEIKNFSGTSVELVGSADVLAGGDLQLTPATGDQSGAAWTTGYVLTTEVFTTNFSFVIEAAPEDTGTIADGLAFVIQATGTNVIGSGGGGIGFQGLDAVGYVVHTWSNNNIGLVDHGDPSPCPMLPRTLGRSA